MFRLGLFFSFFSNEIGENGLYEAGDITRVVELTLYKLCWDIIQKEFASFGCIVFVDMLYQTFIIIHFEYA